MISLATPRGCVNHLLLERESHLRPPPCHIHVRRRRPGRVSKLRKLYCTARAVTSSPKPDTSGNAHRPNTFFFGGKRIGMLPLAALPSIMSKRTSSHFPRHHHNTGVVCYDADFYPYGGERTITNTCPAELQIEGKERDTETGNDDFGARYYSNRFRPLGSAPTGPPSPLTSHTRTSPIRRL